MRNRIFMKPSIAIGDLPGRGSWLIDLFDFDPKQ
jgi:hypothetical protein